MTYQVHVQVDLATFQAMCEAVGSEATQAQTDRLTSWMLNNIGQDYWLTAGEIALEAGVTALYTEVSMRRGECGL